MFEWLETAYATRDSGLSQLTVTPFFSQYRDDPRYAAIVRKAGLPVENLATAETVPMRR